MALKLFVCCLMFVFRLLFVFVPCALDWKEGKKTAREIRVKRREGSYRRVVCHPVDAADAFESPG